MDLNSRRSEGGGGWDLTVWVEQAEREVTLRVWGDQTIGSLMTNIAQVAGLETDWYDDGLWWPSKNCWLLRTRLTLDQYSVSSDSRLAFVPTHRTATVQLPDLQLLRLNVDFSANVFAVVVDVCKQLGIRHPEELSLARRLEASELKKNQGVSATRRTKPPVAESESPLGHHNSNASLFIDGRRSMYSSTLSPNRFMSGRHSFKQKKLGRASSTPMWQGRSPIHSPFDANGSLGPGSVNSLYLSSSQWGHNGLAISPKVPIGQALQFLYRPKNRAEKARINAGWLDSSRSLMEQGMRADSLLMLRFKFNNFFNLHPKYDAIRINMLFEQAKWSILSEELEATKQEIVLFAALQLQIEKLNENEISGDLLSICEGDAEGGGSRDADAIDAALDELQLDLEGGRAPLLRDITDVPQLNNYLKAFRPKKFTLRSFQKNFFVLRENLLTMYTHASQLNRVKPFFTLNLVGCEVGSEINISSGKFIIKIYVNTSRGIEQLWLKTNTEDEFVNWLVGIRLCGSGKTMADASFEDEKCDLRALLALQRPPRKNTSKPPAPRIDDSPKKREDYYTNGGTLTRRIDPKDAEDANTDGRTLMDKFAPSKRESKPLNGTRIEADRLTGSRTSPGLRPGSRIESDGRPGPCWVRRSDVCVEELLPPTFYNKSRTKHLLDLIVSAHGNVSGLSAVESKLTYIRAWQTLPEHGIAYFVVRRKESSKEELLGIGSNRILLLDLKTGRTVLQWRMHNLNTWSVNWDAKTIHISFEDTSLVIECLSADCKVVHEFIGGNIFLSMRTVNSQQTLNEQLFHKLTGGWV